MKWKFLRKIGLYTALFTSLATLHAQAIPTVGNSKQLNKLTTSHMITGVRTSPPLGHVNFCKSSRSQCLKKGSGVKHLNGKSWRQLVSVNSAVNKAIRPRNDKGADKWQTNVRYGDCEDYALTKRKRLLAAGWPSSSLLITTGYLRNGTYHAVLVARTSRGDFVLDNMTRSVKPWSKVRYRWKKQQSASNPRKWVRILSGSTPSLIQASLKKRDSSFNGHSTKRSVKKLRKSKSPVRGLFSKRKAVQKNRQKRREQISSRQPSFSNTLRLKRMRARSAHFRKGKY
jgi:predicted transglutaminase-like cysteine proteinase